MCLHNYSGLSFFNFSWSKNTQLCQVLYGLALYESFYGSPCHLLILPLLCSRPTPDSLLKEFVTNFFQSLPPSTVICLSLLGGAYASLLRELFFSTSSVHAWILFSRLNSCGQPIILLLPVDSIPEGNVFFNMDMEN